MTTPAGWYPDPEQAGGLRYWDGLLWTEHRHAAAVEEAPVETPPAEEPAAETPTVETPPVVETDPMDEILLAAGIAPTLPATPTSAPTAWHAPATTTTSTAPPKRAWWKVAAGVVVALGVVGGLVAWGLSQRSSADKWQARSESWEQSSDEFERRLTKTTKDLTTTRKEVKSLESEVSSLASAKALVTDERQQLQQIVTTVPGVTDSLRDCTDAQYDVATDLFDFIAVFPNGSIEALEANLDRATTVCEEALGAAATLDAIIAGVNG